MNKGNGDEAAREIFLQHCHECHVCGSRVALCPEGEILMARWRSATHTSCRGNGLAGPLRRETDAARGRVQTHLVELFHGAAPG